MGAEEGLEPRQADYVVAPSGVLDAINSGKL